MGRIDLLADIAEKYFLDGLNQAEIAAQVGVTRSMISRMLTEARQKGIVKIQICRPLGFDRELGRALVETFGLMDAQVIEARTGEASVQLDRLGEAAARVLTRFIAPGWKLGLAWGTSVRATGNALQVHSPMPLKIVQLVGALGARNEDYDGHAVVQLLAEKFGGEGFYLNAPFLMESPETVRALSNVSSVRETLELGRECDLALVGIGSTREENSSFFQASYISMEELRDLQDAGAVGDVCGLFFDIDGNAVGQSFSSRTVTISSEGLLAIPIRIGVAGGLGKVFPILGALRSGFINHLVTDRAAAAALLENR
jgi:DNA-binding transcriptional regulator LsrR (DeoR family)